MRSKLSALHEGSPAAFSAVFCACITVVAFLIYSLSGLLPSPLRTYDTTREGLYTLTDISKELVRALEIDINVTYVGDEASDSTVTELLLERYASLSDRLSVTRTSTDDAELASGSVVISSEKRSVTLKPSELFGTSDGYRAEAYYYYSYFYSEGYVSCSFYEFMEQYGEELELYDLTFCEAKLTEAIRYASSDRLTNVYALTEHGETELNGIITSALRRSLIEITYGQLGGGIPQDADAVLISAPTSDVTEKELELLREYLSKGGRLAVVTSHTAVSKLPNLLSLCREYGMTTDGGLICDDGAEEHLEDYEQLTYPTVMTDSYGDYAEGLSERLMYSNGVGISFAQSASLFIKSLADTSESAYSKQDAENTVKPSFNEETDTRARRSVGALSTNTESGGSILWLPSTAYITEANDVASYGNNFATFEASLELLLGADRLTLSPKSLLAEALTPPTNAFYIAIAVSVLLPCATVTVGFIITAKRRSADRSENEIKEKEITV